MASAALLVLAERQVRVIAPFIGGGAALGPKIMIFHPSCAAALDHDHLGPPNQMDRGPQ